MKRLIHATTTALSLLMVSIALTAGAGSAKFTAPVPENLQGAVNTQIRHELEAAYLYLGMANHFEKQGLLGFAHWFTVQFFEEITHSRQMMKFLIDKGHDVRLETLQPASIGRQLNALGVAEMALKAEEEQTDRIHRLFEQAREAKAYDLETLMAFFVREQNEEEASFNDLKQKLTLAGTSPEAILALDRELAKRVMPAVQPLPPTTRP